MTGQRQADVGQETRAASAFGLWADPVFLLALLALWIALAIVFHGEPQLDRAVSEFFFASTPCAGGSAQTACGAFPAASSAFWQVLRAFFHYLPIAVAIVVIAVLASEITAGRSFEHSRTRFAATALIALVLGPGLLVNVLLKNHWGRPRPVSTELFGGNLPFVPAGEWSNACQSNCSFVSGEASSIFWLICLVPLLPPSQRRVGAIIAVATAIFACGLRVAFGGHYLSDVVLGGLSTLIIFSALATLVEWGVEARRRR
ncbi:phosphatase PAP2 family protein [Mesorhizobium sp. BAC0120]|uniref:phosphatase PAP2 family protein n=1 Tax=Mesorhizobium sp. BAC0120 TaxID=3090670 RepID=UPI00298C9169|nr:phosphatase PAP2 family protein [Mesorhizobium sp. BAC0120]MDW6022140.1 phosphatase PAP2 family protein [Mesorhizobium sp. BAC0120]